MSRQEINIVQRRIPNLKQLGTLFFVNTNSEIVEITPLVFKNKNIEDDI